MSLDVLSAYPEDSGTYTVRATNKNGQATSQLNINVQREFNGRGYLVLRGVFLSPFLRVGERLLEGD